MRWQRIGESAQSLDTASAHVFSTGLCRAMSRVCLRAGKTRTHHYTSLPPAIHLWARRLIHVWAWGGGCLRLGVVVHFSDGARA